MRTPLPPSAPGASGGPLRRALRHARLAELARFGSVGAAAYVVDVLTFNLLLLGPGQVLGDRPLTAKVAASGVATLAAWLGNRYWAFARTRTARPVRELATFAAVNVLGAGAAVACLAVSRYVLGLDSPLADNVAANVVGVGVGTVVRYVCYRRVVFTGGVRRGGADVTPAPARAAADPTS
ncbi:GtrA family protein [Actinotalea sp. AC32]|nr:GtrA family protein [Actinotalea sp. AC32]